MPKRSNKFQKLIYLIQSELAEGALVEESALLKDSGTGTEVEVDVLIRAEIAGTPVTIAIECRDRRRAATVEWIREVVGKFKTLPVDKVVVVSSSGFTREARKRAALEGIDALSLSDAEDADWIRYVSSLAQLRLAGFTFTIASTTLQLVNPQLLVDRSKLSTDCLISKQNEPDKGTVNDFANSFIRSEDIARRIMHEWMKSAKRADNYLVTVTWKPASRTTVRDSDGIEHEIAHMRCEVGVSVADTPMKLTPARYRDLSIAHSEVPNVFQPGTDEKFIVLATEEKGEIGGGAILEPSTNQVRKIKRERSDEPR